MWLAILTHLVTFQFILKNSNQNKAKECVKFPHILFGPANKELLNLKYIVAVKAGSLMTEM